MQRNKAAGKTCFVPAPPPTLKHFPRHAGQKTYRLVDDFLFRSSILNGYNAVGGQGEKIADRQVGY